MPNLVQLWQVLQSMLPLQELFHNRTLNFPEFQSLLGFYRMLIEELSELKCLSQYFTLRMKFMFKQPEVLTLMAQANSQRGRKPLLDKTKIRTTLQVIDRISLANPIDPNSADDHSAALKAKMFISFQKQKQQQLDQVKIDYLRSKEHRERLVQLNQKLLAQQRQNIERRLRRRRKSQEKREEVVTLQKLQESVEETDRAMRRLSIRQSIRQSQGQLLIKRSDDQLDRVIAEMKRHQV